VVMSLLTRSLPRCGRHSGRDLGTEAARRL